MLRSRAEEEAVKDGFPNNCCARFLSVAPTSSSPDADVDPCHPKTCKMFRVHPSNPLRIHGVLSSSKWY